MAVMLRHKVANIWCRHVDQRQASVAIGLRTKQKRAHAAGLRWSPMRLSR